MYRLWIFKVFSISVYKTMSDVSKLWWINQLFLCKFISKTRRKRGASYSVIGSHRMFTVSKNTLKTLTKYFKFYP